MDKKLFDRFESLQNQGLKKDAKAALRDFIRSFKNKAEKRAWSKNYLEQRTSNGPIRHELYAEIIYPVLAEGCGREDVWSMLWLARTSANLDGGYSTFAKDLERPSNGFLRRCYELEPESDEIRQELLMQILNYFAHCAHEWPSGILYGMDGATLEQCAELTEDIDLARTLDTSNKHEAFLADFQAKLDKWITRLTRG